MPSEGLHPPHAIYTTLVRSCEVHKKEYFLYIHVHIKAEIINDPLQGISITLCGLLECLKMFKMLLN